MFKEDMDALAQHLENMVKSKTIVGEPIIAGSATVIPIITASFGFALGDGEGTDSAKGGGKGSGGGGGAKISPTALLVVKGEDVQVFNLGEKGSLDKLVSLVPEIITKISEFKTPKSGSTTSD
ncbi:MAG: spore germination protein GerW family protein [Syntrophomonas sp.]|nr:spore germination protein GerW family protein [Syntrophomonas sp.]